MLITARLKAQRTTLEAQRERITRRVVKKIAVENHVYIKIYTRALHGSEMVSEFPKTLSEIV